MGLEEIIPAIFLIAVLILIIPNFLKTNLKLKQLIQNLFVWFIIVVSIVIISYLIL
tara:strand:- start:2149 stop:2316 length:168 start_codon:yes stop_codon:yes gene_type:complete